MILINAESPCWAQNEAISILAFCHWDNGVSGMCLLVAAGDLPHIHEAYARVVAGEFGAIQPWSPSPRESELLLKQHANGLIESKLHELALSWNYSSFSHLASYCTSTNPTWAEEAKLGVAYRDRLEEMLYASLANDTFTVEEFKAAMPAQPDRTNQ